MLNIDKKVWEQTEASEFGDFTPLELGGHACVIRKADNYIGKSGNESLRVQVDIDKPDKQAGYFREQFDNDTRVDKIWSNSATKYYSLKEENYGILKGMITAVENSNPGFKFDMDETKLTGKKIAGVFGWEEYQKQDGSVGVATKLVQIRSLDKLNEIKIPKVKKLDGSFVDYEEYKNHRIVASAEEIFGSSIIETEPSDLPFEI